MPPDITILYIKPGKKQVQTTKTNKSHKRNKQKQRLIVCFVLTLIKYVIIIYDDKVPRNAVRVDDAMISSLAVLLYRRQNGGRNGAYIYCRNSQIRANP